MWLLMQVQSLLQPAACFLPPHVSLLTAECRIHSLQIAAINNKYLSITHNVVWQKAVKNASS